MNSIVVDQVTQAKLDKLDQSVAIQDEGGRLSGYFTPAGDCFTYNGIQAPITNEELERRSKAGGGRSLREIMADLEQRQ
jgi:hypothetical protein